MRNFICDQSTVAFPAFSQTPLPQGKHLSVLMKSTLRRNQRSTPSRTLNDHSGWRQPCQNAVSGSKHPTLHFNARGLLRNEQPSSLQNFISHPHMHARVNRI